VPPRIVTVHSELHGSRQSNNPSMRVQNPNK
jgi:hypothetical protein